GSALAGSNRLAEGRDYLKLALEEQEELIRDFPGEPAHHHQLAVLLNDLGISHLGNLGGGRTEVEQARDLFEKAVREERIFLESAPSNHDGRFALAKQLTNAGAILERLGEYAAAETRGREGLELMKGLVSEVPQDPDYRGW